MKKFTMIILMFFFVSCGTSKELKAKSWEGICVRDGFGTWCYIKIKIEEGVFCTNKYRFKYEPFKCKNIKEFTYPKIGDYIIVKYSPIFEDYTYTFYSTNLKE